MAIAMGWHKPDNVAGSSAPAIMVGLFVATGGLLFGYDTGWVDFERTMRVRKRLTEMQNNLRNSGHDCLSSKVLYWIHRPN
jgi:hypothetical protein